MPPATRSGRGRRAARPQRDATHRPVSAKTLALELAEDGWLRIEWREGGNAVFAPRFARLRVRPAGDDAKRNEPTAEEWLPIEWPEGENEPDHYWLATLPAVQVRHTFVRTALPLDDERPAERDHAPGRGTSR